MEHLLYSFLNASLLFFLYKTEAFVEYSKLFRLGKIFGIDKYEKWVDAVGDSSYWEYLTFERQTFLRKLVSCPFCVSFWLNALAFLYYENVVYLLINLWLTLFLYLLLTCLLKKSS
tara:strand:+ start:57 stop:404 length:348 start_codon:yes stop_codon:yes gene_type:complete